MFSGVNVESQFVSTKHIDFDTIVNMACYVVTASEGRRAGRAMRERVWRVTLSLPAKVGRQIQL